MTRAVHRAGFRPLAFASRQLLLRPAALKIAASIVLTLLALGLYSLSRGSYPLPASTLARALLAPQEMGEQPRFILFDIRLPRILMALLCGAMLGLAGAAMQSITRNGLADPGLIGVKEGASIVVLALVLFFPAVGLVWRPLAGMVGGIAVALLVLTLARDCSRPRFILIGIGVSWSLAAAVGIFMTTADVRDVQTAMIWLAGSLQAATWPLLAVAFCWALPGAIILFCTAGGGRGAAGRPDRHRPRRTSAAADGAALFCAGAADLGQRLLRRQPGFCGPDGAAYGAFCAARRPGIAAVRQRADWRLAGAGDRYPWPAGVCPAADPGGDCHCPGGVPVLRYLALASP